MKRSIVLSALALMMLVGSSGCFVYSHPAHGRSARSSSRPECHPSQHWDGSHCVHNGKGHGARKHDD